MVDIRFEDRGPLVVALQVLVNRFLRGSRIAPDGVFGPLTREAVIEVQRRVTGLAESGQVDVPTWNRLSEGSRLCVIGANDIYDPRHDHVTPPWLRGPGWIATSGMSNGVADVTGQIAASALAQRSKIVLLRFHGHGAPGLMGVTGGTGTMRDSAGETIRDERGQPVRGDHARDQTTISNETAPAVAAHLRGLRSLFAPFGSVELHGCRVGMGAAGHRLLRSTADALQVPASAGIGSQSFGETTSLRFEGPVVTLYPNGRNLREWIRHVQSSRPVF